MSEVKELDVLAAAHAKAQATGLSTGYQAAIDFTAGAVGGIACTITGQPFDTIKVKLQTYPHLYNGTLQCTKSILKNEGITGLFQGTTPALAAIMGETAVLFLAYGCCQRVVARISGKANVSQLNTLERACSGSSAAVFSSLVLCPTELIKCRLQALTEVMATSDAIQKRIGPWQVTKDLIRNDGPLGLFQGLTSTWLREVPGYFFFFFGYEITKGLLTPAGKTKDDLGPLKLVCSGGIAGASLWISIYPIDVVKSRIQVQSLVGKMPGFLPTFIQVVRAEGVRALYNGLVACVLRSFPANAALFMAYEYSRKWMMDHAPERAYEKS